VSATPHRFGPADVELAAEMGHRAALAIDNARLLHETQRAVRVRDEFLCVASHELRTPTTSLKLAVQALLRSTATRKAVPAETLDRHLNLILRKAERLQQLTNELLDVTRIEQGRLELQLAEVELGDLVREVVEHFEVELAWRAVGCPSSASRRWWGCGTGRAWSRWSPTCSRTPSSLAPVGRSKSTSAKLMASHSWW